MFAQNKKFLAACSVVVLSMGLQACGGGSSSDADASAEAPSFAGTYDVTLSKTSDPCATGLDKSFKAVQTVTQSGRAITLVSNAITLQGSVDVDNAGLSTSFQNTTDGVLVTTTMVYRSTATPGLYGAGLSVVAKSGNTTCSLSYNGQAKLK